MSMTCTLMKGLSRKWQDGAAQHSKQPYITYLTKLQNKYCQGKKNPKRCDAFALLKSHLPSHMMLLAAPGAPKVDPKTELNNGIQAFQQVTKKQREEVRAGINMVVQKYCKKNTLFCELTKGLSKNFERSQEGGPAAKAYKKYLSSLRTEYCATTAQLKQHRCAVFTILNRQKTVRRSQEQKHAKRAQNLQAALSNAKSRYCKGQSKLMCQVVSEAEEMYVMSLKPGKKDVFSKFLQRMHANFCHSATTKKRCVLIHLLQKQSSKAVLRPKGVKSAVPPSPPAPSTSSNAGGDGGTAASKALDVSTNPPPTPSASTIAQEPSSTAKSQQPSANGGNSKPETQEARAQAVLSLLKSPSV